MIMDEKSKQTRTGYAKLSDMLGASWADVVHESSELFFGCSNMDIFLHDSGYSSDV
jgi:hypothetical protein